MKKTIWVALAVVLIGGILWWNNTRTETPDLGGEPIKIGGLFSLSGYAAFAGEAARDGFIMAVEDSGMDIKYVIEDFKSYQKSVLTGASKLINIDNVSVVIGPEWLEFGEVIAPMAKQKEIPFISPWMNSEPEWIKNHGFYFSGTPSERSQFKKIVEYMAEIGVQNIAIVYSNNSWSQNNLLIFTDEVDKNGKVNIVGEFNFSQDETDYRTGITKLDNLKPDAVYSLLASSDAHGLFTKQIRDLGLTYVIYADESRAEDPVLQDRFGQYVVGQIYTRHKEYKNSSTFNEKYEKRFGKKVGAISAPVAYDMTTLVLKAIEEGAKNSEEIREYMANVKNYDGYSNLITFNQDGQVDQEEVEIRKITAEGSELIKE